MAQAPKLSEEQKTAIRKLREETKLPYAAIAAQFGVSSQNIIRICRPDFYERQKEANRKYQSENTAEIIERNKHKYRHYRLRFNVDNDKAVIEFLNKQDNIQNYVRQKVIEDIQKEQSDQGPKK